jgi:hypothetical protein
MERRVKKMVTKAAILTGAESDSLIQSRTAIVRVPKGVATELFGGWGVRI